MKIQKMIAYLLAILSLLILLPQISGADPLDNWHWRNPLPQGNSLVGVAYGNGIFVAVGAGGTILTSPDGVTWTLRPSGVTFTLVGVTYGNGTFVAVGDYGTILTSSDGVSWTKRNSGTSVLLGGVTYGDGKFVVAGGYTPVCGADPPCTAIILTSTDAVNWTTTYSGGSLGGLGVVYGNGIFIAFEPYHTVLRSPDGMNWTRLVSDGFWGLAYGNGIFVGFGPGGEVLTSPDGMTWTTGAKVIEPGPLTITYVNGTFVAVGLNGTILTSLDGVTWKERTSGITSELCGAAYGNETFVVVGTFGTLLTSPDGDIWTKRSSETTFTTLYGVSFIGDSFVAAGEQGTLLVSQDGVSWSHHDLGVTTALYEVAYGNGTLVVIGDDCPGSWSSGIRCGAIFNSPDGLSWTKVSSGTHPKLYGVTYGNGVFVAVGDQIVLTSSDGVTWIPTIPTSVDRRLSDVTYGNGIFVAVGDGYDGKPISRIMTSPDGVSWKKQDPVVITYIHSVGYGNGLFVAVGHEAFSNYETILVSTDGASWSKSWEIDSIDLWEITYGGGNFIVLGRDWRWESRIFTSLDAATWTERSLGNAFVDYLGGVAYGNGTFVIVGEDGAILQSDPLIAETVSTPTIPDGLTSGTIGTPYFYTTGSSTSSLSHTVEYQFDWKGDGSDLSSWGPTSQSKTWATAGIYNVSARARCAQDVSVISDWSNPLSVGISIPNLSVTPSAYDFGNVKVKRRETTSFVVENTGMANLFISTTIITGADASSFTIIGGKRNKTIKPGKKLIIMVAFKPKSQGPKSANLEITSNDPGAPIIDIPLNGTGM